MSSQGTSSNCCWATWREPGDGLMGILKLACEAEHPFSGRTRDNGLSLPLRLGARYGARGPGLDESQDLRLGNRIGLARSLERACVHVVNKGSGPTTHSLCLYGPRGPVGQKRPY